MKNLKKILVAIVLAALILTSTSIAFASTSLVTTGSCNLRTGPGLNYSTITSIGKNVSLNATSSKTDNRGVKWYKVKYNGNTGWVSSVYAKKGSPSSKKVVVATGDTYIRSKANKSSSKLGVMYAGERATYLNKSSKDSRGVRWYKVSCDGVTGWVSSVNSYIK